MSQSTQTSFTWFSGYWQISEGHYTYLCARLISACNVQWRTTTSLAQSNRMRERCTPQVIRLSRCWTIADNFWKMSESKKPETVRISCTHDIVPQVSRPTGREHVNLAAIPLFVLVSSVNSAIHNRTFHLHLRLLVVSRCLVSSVNWALLCITCVCDCSVKLESYLSSPWECQPRRAHLRKQGNCQWLSAGIATAPGSLQTEEM